MLIKRFVNNFKNPVAKAQGVKTKICLLP